LRKQQNFSPKLRSIIHANGTLTQVSGNREEHTSPQKRHDLDHLATPRTASTSGRPQIQGEGRGGTYQQILPQIQGEGRGGTYQQILHGGREGGSGRVVAMARRGYGSVKGLNNYRTF
jgi:hypothetical protein